MIFVNMMIWTYVLNTRKPLERIVEGLKNKINPLHNVNWNAAMERAAEIVKEEGGLND